MFRKINDSIDRFCALHRNFGIPNLMLYIVIGNAVVYFLSLFSSASAVSFLALDMGKVLQGELWRIVTFVFVPDSGGFWLLIALYFYYFVGKTLENNWGSGKFTIYYGSGVLLTVLASLIGQLCGIGAVVYGTGYVNLSMFFAFAMLYPDLQVLLFFIIPVKVKWIAYVDAAFFAVEVVTALAQGSFLAALLPVVAILNFFIYFSPAFHATAQRQRASQSAQSHQYRRSVHEAQQAAQAHARQGYHHKCCVCGRTDAEYPDLQFRYCSRCAGYHCFCSDHIFNHIHFTEETDS